MCQIGTVCHVSAFIFSKMVNQGSLFLERQVFLEIIFGNQWVLIWSQLLQSLVFAVWVTWFHLELPAVFPMSNMAAWLQAHGGHEPKSLAVMLEVITKCLHSQKQEVLGSGRDVLQETLVATMADGS